MFGGELVDAAAHVNPGAICSRVPSQIGGWTSFMTPYA